MIAFTGLGARITWKGEPLHAVEWPKPERCSMGRNGNHVLMQSCPAAALDSLPGQWMNLICRESWLPRLARP
jgi:hypothetical protein